MYSTSLLVATDFGTTFATTSYCLIRDRQIISGPTRISFDGADDPQTPVIFTKSTHKWLWGHVVDSKLYSGDLEASEVIRYLKLSLSDDPTAQGLRHRINTELQRLGTDTEKLMELYFREMRDIVNRKLQFAPNKAIQQLPQEWLISVPQMWTPKQTRKMMAAAQNAGLPQCSLVSEPQCVAACLLEPESMTETLLVADIGGGTADFASFYRDDDPHQPNKVKLVMVGAEGSLGGSIWINEAFRTYLESREYEEDKVRLEQLAKKLEIPENNFLAQADTHFELAKLRMTAENYDTKFPITIFPSGKADRQKPVKFYLTWNDMQGFLSEAIDKIHEHVENQVLICENAGKRVKTIILSGGLSRNPVLKDSLRKRFMDQIQDTDRNDNPRQIFPWNIRVVEPQDRHLSMSVVSDGALRLKCLKGDFNVVEPYFQYSIGVAQDEQPDRSIPGHKDVWITKKTPGGQRKVPLNRKIQKSYVDGNDIILNRINWLIMRGDRRKEGFTESRPGTLYYDVNDNEHIVKQTLYFASNDLLDHCSIDDHSDQIRELCTISQTFTDAESHNWDKIKGFDGDTYWEVPYTIKISGDPTNLMFRLDLHKADEEGGASGGHLSNSEMKFEELVERSKHSYLTDSVPPAGPTNTSDTRQRKRQKRER